MASAPPIMEEESENSGLQENNESESESLSKGEKKRNLKLRDKRMEERD
jgi:hypothetical protein